MRPSVTAEIVYNVISTRTAQLKKSEIATPEFKRVANMAQQEERQIPYFRADLEDIVLPKGAMKKLDKDCILENCDLCREIKQAKHRYGVQSKRFAAGVLGRFIEAKGLSDKAIEHAVKIVGYDKILFVKYCGCVWNADEIEDMEATCDGDSD